MKKYEKPVAEMIELQIEEEIATQGTIGGETGYGSAPDEPGW